MSQSYTTTNSELGQRILQALRERAPVKVVGNNEYRTRCLRPEKHKHADVHPYFDFNPDRGGICRVCGYKAGVLPEAGDGEGVNGHG